MTHLVVAIDGPGASGKGTLATHLAREFDLAFLDTGLLYRFVGYRALQAGISPDDHAAATQLANALAENLNLNDLNDPILRAEESSRAASVFSAIPGVRTALLDFQYHFAANPPAQVNGRPCRGVILDGRDIGTVICPNAPVKFFVTASVEERARRRVLFMQERGFPADYDTILAELKERDLRDSTRATAPLKPAPDAMMIDTTHKSIHDVVEQATEKCRAALAQLAG